MKKYIIEDEILNQLDNVFKSNIDDIDKYNKVTSICSYNNLYFYAKNEDMNNGKISTKLADVIDKYKHLIVDLTINNKLNIPSFSKPKVHSKTK